MSNLNWKHTDGCFPKSTESFIVKTLIQKVKDKVVENPLVSTQQLYETERNKQVSNMTAKKEFKLSEIGLFENAVN